MLVTSLLTKPSVWYKIGILWVNIMHVKVYAIFLGFWLQIHMNQIFQMYAKIRRLTKKSSGSAGPRRMVSCQSEWANFFFNHQLWPLVLLQLLDLQEFKVTHLKDLIHISLELEAQGFCMTFIMCYDGSKYPYFILYRWSCQNRSDEHCKYWIGRLIKLGYWFSLELDSLY